MERAVKTIWPHVKTQIADDQLKADIEEFLDAGEWALALDVMEDWALQNSQTAL